MTDVVEQNTIAGSFFYAKGSDKFALWWDPYSGRMTLVVNPLKPMGPGGGAFMPVTSPKYEHAPTRKAAKALAREFFSTKEATA